MTDFERIYWHNVKLDLWVGYKLIMTTVTDRMCEVVYILDEDPNKCEYIINMHNKSKSFKNMSDLLKCLEFYFMDLEVTVKMGSTDRSPK